MTSRQRVVGGRPSKASHFVQEVEMIPVAHPPHSRGTGSSREILPPTFPGQDPVLRTLPTSLSSKYQQDTEKEREDSPRITAESLRKLQDIVEAQKNFLKFQEMRNILLETRNSDSDKENSVTVSTSRSGRVRKVAKLRKSNGEKSQADDQSRKRKSPIELTTRQEQPSPLKSPRTQDTSVQTSIREENIPQSRVEIAVQTLEAETCAVENEVQTVQEGEAAQHKGPVLEGGVECDWAYWYLPHTGTVRPARVTIRSRTKKVEQPTEEPRPPGKDLNDKPWRKFMRKPSEERKGDNNEKDDRTATAKVPDKPWRVNMKNPTSKSGEVSKTVEEVRTKKAEKPWRVNMKRESSTDKDDASKPNDIPQPEPDARPWRANMKKTVEPLKPLSPVVKKRHYDRKEVREYMKSKRAKEREEKEEKEREEAIRKEVIKSRLTELEQVQKQITESSSSELRSLGGIKEKEKKLSPEAEEALRMKLLELTEQMKEQWRARREVRREKSFSIAEEVYGKSNLERDIDENNINIVSDNLDSSRKVSAKESLKVTNLVEEKLSLVESLPPQRSRLSSISDATEIRSLSDKIDRSDRSGERLERSEDQSHSLGGLKGDNTQVTDDIWSQRLFGGPIDCPKVLNNLSNVPSDAVHQHLSTPLTDEVPERDLSEVEEKGRLLAVKEIYARHQEDLRKIKAQVKESGVDTTPPPLQPEHFSPCFPSIITRSKADQLALGEHQSGNDFLISASNKEGEASVSKHQQDVGDKVAPSRSHRPNLTSPLPVPPPPAQEIGLPSADTGESDGPPVWMEVTKCEDEDEGEDRMDGVGNIAAAKIKNLVETANDPFNFINTVARKYESASELQLSEGPLSSRLSSVSEQSRDSSAISSHYARLSKERSESRRKESQSEKSRAKMESDSESTLQGVEDTILRDPPERQRRRRRKERSKSSSSKTRERKNNQCHEDETPTSVVVRRSNGEEEGAGQTASSLPSALHLRFLTELHQLESVTSTQQLLAELEQVKKFAFEHNQGLAQVQGEVARQRRLLEMQEGEDRVTQRQQQLQEMYTEKLAALLHSQSEATKVTSEVARQLAKMTSDGQAGPVVRELQGLVEKLQRVDEVPASRSSVLATTTKSTSTSISRTVEHESEVNEQVEDSKEESKSISRDDMDRGSSSSIQVDPMSFGSKTPSSILEVLDQNQAAGSSIQRTISEALASISEGDQRTRSSITAEVEEELSTDYSSQFEEESTLREQTLKTLLPSESQRRQSSTLLGRRNNLRRDLSTASDSSIHFSEVEEEGATRPSSSLFSDNDSFTKFSLEMVSQYMLEEKVRAQHKASLLKIKEASLISEAKKKVEELEKVKQEMVDKGKDEKMPKIKKKQRNILLKLKERRAEIASMRENLKVAERERKFMVDEQRRLMGKHKETVMRSSDIKKAKGAEFNTSNGDSADQESDAAEDPFAKIEVLKGLKRLDKSRKTMTSKEKKFVDKKDLSGIFDTSRVEESGSEAMLSLTEEVETEMVTPPSSTITVMSQNKSRSSSASHRNQKGLSSQKSSTPKKAKALNQSSAEAESEVESLGALSQMDSEAGTLSHLDTTPLTDNSDIEARIAALSDKLSNRMKTAARLKKEQRRERKEALRWQEDSLRKQIEKYDNLISEGRQEIVRSSEQAENLTKPKIKSPKSSKEKREEESSLVTTPEVSHAEGSQSISLQSASYQSPNINVKSGVHDVSSPSHPSGSKPSDHLSDSSGSAEVASSSTVLASPVKGSPAPPFIHSRQPAASPSTATSVEEELEEEDVPSSLPVSEEAAKYSSSFEQQTQEGEDTREKSSSSKFITDDRSLKSTLETHETRKLENVKNTEQVKTKEDFKDEQNAAQKLDNKVDTVTDQLWEQLLNDTINEINLERFRSHSSVQKSKAVDNDAEENEEITPTKKHVEKKKAEVVKSPRKSHQRSISVTLKPQDLMLTTFDLTSPSSSDEASPLKKAISHAEGDESESEGKLDEQVGGQEEFLDDDFGLSAIRQEAEILRLQQAKVEEEIARIAREAASAEAARVPDRPPPPYTAPAQPTPALKANIPLPPPKPVVPNSKEQVWSTVNAFVEVLYKARKEGHQVQDVEFEPSLVCKDILTELESDLEDGAETSAVEQFLNMIWELTVDKVLVCFEHENMTQPPPWLPPLPLEKLHFLAPNNLDELKARVASEVVKDLKLAPRVSREALMVRWSGKKRDRVDEILVRELQEEEAMWTDYIKEEAVVKQQMGEALMDMLIMDTVEVFSAIFKRRHQKSN